MNSKYSNFLTMLLVIFIVVILGIVAYFAYDALTSKKIENDAQAALEEFGKATTSVKQNTVKNTVVENEIKNEVVADNVDRQDALSQLTQQTQDNQIEQTEEKPQEKPEPEKVYMEDYEILGKIKIPKTNIEYPILDGVNKRILEIAVGKVAYGANLNEVGNSIIFGHNYRNGMFFSNNKNLSKGDDIYITDQTGNTIVYSIYNIYETDASDAEYFKRDTEGRREISLQTCTDDGARRIIIWAAEK